MTGHEEKDKRRPIVNWRALAKASDGLVIYNNLISSSVSGVKWSISNNNNINLTLLPVIIAKVLHNCSI